MRSSRDLITVLMLLALFVAAGLLLGGRGSSASRLPGPEETPNPSYTNDRASGTKGAFEWAETLGYEPVPWRQSWSRLSASETGVLLIVDPRIQEPIAALTGNGNFGNDQTLLSVRDAVRLRRWLNSGAGHTAILLSSRLPSGLGGPKPSPDDRPTFGDALDLIVESASPDTGRTEFAPLQPVAETQGMLSLHSSSDARIKRTRPDGLALFGDAAGPVALEIPVGRGRLVAVADGAAFSNSELPRSENAVFLANLLVRYGRPGGRVLFDEYHHGDAAETSRLGLGRFGAAFAAGLYPALPGGGGWTGRPAGDSVRPAGGRRFAALPGPSRRLCRVPWPAFTAGPRASQTALETLYRQFLRDICGRLALPPDVALERLAEVAARRGQVDKDRLRRLLATCELRLDSGKVSEAELLDLTRQMESIRKEIGIA